MKFVVFRQILRKSQMLAGVRLDRNGKDASFSSLSNTTSKLLYTSTLVNRAVETKDTRTSVSPNVMLLSALTISTLFCKA